MSCRLRQESASLLLLSQLGRRLDSAHKPLAPIHPKALTVLRASSHSQVEAM